MDTAYEPSLSDYLGALRRRALPALIAFVIVFAVAGVVALLLPPTYRASGTILVESQQIPDDLVRSTVTSYADERILVIKQRVMTNGNLRKIVDKYDLFAAERQSMAASELLEKMRQRIGVELISADVTGNRKATIAFKVFYDDKDANTAYRVTNELVTLFLEENVRTRTERASETTEFLTQEADRLKAELEAAESQLAEYKQRNSGTLPQHLELHMNMASRLESDLKEVEREYKSTQEELRYLDVELTSARSGLSSQNPAGPSPAQQLEALRTQYTAMSATYSETHPDLRALKRKIESLEKSLGPEGKKADISPSEANELVVTKIQARIAAAEARLASYAQQRKQLAGQRAGYERQILQTPQVERGMTSLMRDYENAKAKYEEVRAKQMSAQMSENLEEEKKAERFALLEPPFMPDLPIEPNRKKIAAMGFFLALASSGGMVMVLEAIQQRVFGVRALGALVGHAPLVAIPYIKTSEELARRKNPRKRRLIVAGAFLLVVVTLIGMHTLYQPLDTVWFNLLAKFE